MALGVDETNNIVYLYTDDETLKILLPWDIVNNTKFPKIKHCCTIVV